MTFHGARPLFRPAHLGSKWPTADVAVELVDRPGQFFLVQVKTTRGGKSAPARRRRLRTPVTRSDFNALARAKLLTYIVGVDERQERAYIRVAVGLRRRNLASISLKHSLGQASVRRSLFNEVASFWSGVGRKVAAEFSAFTD